MLVLQCTGNKISCAFCQNPLLYVFVANAASALLRKRLSSALCDQKRHLLLVDFFSLQPETVVNNDITTRET